MVFVAHGFRRERFVERAVVRGHYVRPDERLLAALTALAVLLGFALLLIVVLED